MLLPHPNVQVEDDRVTVTMPFSWLKGVLATAIYGVIFFAVVSDGFPIQTFTLPYVIVFGVSTLLWLWYISRQRAVVVFDGFESQAHRRNLFYALGSIDFTDIAEVASVSETGEWIFWALGIALMLVSLHAVHTLILDVEQKTIILGRAFGLWRTEKKMENFAGLHISRHYTNGIYTGTHAAMEFDDPPASFDLFWAYFTKRLTALVDETNAIIHSTVEQKDEEPPAS